MLSTSGDTHLGGDDFDARVVAWLVDDFKKTEGIDLRGDKSAMQRVLEAACRAKEEARAWFYLRFGPQHGYLLINFSSQVSTSTQSPIQLAFITATSSGPKHIDTVLTRAKLCVVICVLFPPF